MKKIVILLIFISHSSFSIEEYERDSSFCDNGAHNMSICASRANDFYKSQLNKLIKIRVDNYNLDLKRHYDEKEKTEWNKARIVVLEHLLKSFEDSNKTWELFVNQDCNSITGYDLPPKYGSNSRSSSYNYCVIHHTKKRIIEQEKIVYCEENGGCSY